MDKSHGWGLVGFTRACVVASIFLALGGCGTSNLAPMAGVAPVDAMDSVRNTDFSARFPLASERNSEIPPRPPERAESTQPFLFPGSDVAPERPRDRDPEMRTASLQQAAFLKGDGVEMNFEGADVQTVAKTLLGDILQLNFVVDPRVQGNVTLASAGPIARKDVLPAFESVLRMQNAAIVRSGDLVKIVPMPEAGAGGAISVGAGEPGFGVSLVPLRYTSASTVAKTAESFLSRPGAIRVVQSRNLLLIQGTTAERQAALDVVATFDVEWLQNQSVGVYPLKSTSPETMIGELERVFETSEGGLGQGVIRFQPISRMNAVMVVTKNPKLLAQTTQWVRRLDRSDTTGTTLRTFRLKNGKATEVAKILNDIFGQKSGAGDSATKQLAPGVESAQARMDALDRGSLNGSGSNANGVTNASNNSDNRGAGTIAAAFESFANRKNAEPDASGGSSGNIPRGTFQNLRISADAANNSIVVYSNQEDYRVVERALRDIDRPLMQVAIDATVAEVTLTDELQFGVQAFLTSKDVGLGKNKGAVSLLSAGQDVAQAALLQRVAPGLNLLLGSEVAAAPDPQRLIQHNGRQGAVVAIDRCARQSAGPAAGGRRSSDYDQLSRGSYQCSHADRQHDHDAEYRRDPESAAPRACQWTYSARSRSGNLQHREWRSADADADDCPAPRPLHRLGDQRSNRVACRPHQRAQSEDTIGHTGTSRNQVSR